LLKLGNNREAISILRSAAHLEVREPAVYEALGVAYIIDGNCRRAALAFKTALSLTPWARNAVHGLAKSLLELKQIDEVLALLVGYVERKPQDIEAKQMLAKAYACRGQFRSAIAQLTQIWSSVENNESTLRLRATLANNIGGYYLDDGEKQQAEQWFGKAIAIAPKESPIPYDNLARVWLRNGETRRAFDIAKHAQEQFGNNPDTMCVLASCFEKVGLYDEAIAQIKPIVESGTATANIHAQLGGLLTEGGSDREAALTFLKEAFKKFKTNEIVANNLAYAYLLTGDAESARPIIEKCLRNLESQWTQPIHTICLTATYGLLRIIEGDLEEGIRLYRRAEKLCPQLGLKEFANTVIQKMHLELARAYFRKHEYQRAKGEVRKGLAVRDGKMIYEQQLLALENQLASMGGAVGD
jgi:Flp pilus assembly protein TadD